MSPRIGDDNNGKGRTTSCCVRVTSSSILISLPLSPISPICLRLARCTSRFSFRNSTVCSFLRDLLSSSVWPRFLNALARVAWDILGFYSMPTITEGQVCRPRVELLALMAIESPGGDGNPRRDNATYYPRAT